MNKLERSEEMNLTGETLSNVDISKCPCCGRGEIIMTPDDEDNDDEDNDGEDNEGERDEFWECNHCGSEWDVIYDEDGDYYHYVTSDDYNDGFNPNSIPNHYCRCYEEGIEAFESCNSETIDYLECPYETEPEINVHDEEFELRKFYWEQGFKIARAEHTFDRRDVAMNLGGRSGAQTDLKCILQRERDINMNYQ